MNESGREISSDTHNAAYEFRLVESGQAGDWLSKGWEPVPNVPVVYYDTENLPRTVTLRQASVFLRREIEND